MLEISQFHKICSHRETTDTVLDFPGLYGPMVVVGGGRGGFTPIDFEI